MDYYLKFRSQKAAVDKLIAFGVIVKVKDDESAPFIQAQEGFDVDFVGGIPDVTGFHVNVRAKDEHKELAKLSIDVATPYRTWAS